MQHGRYKVIWVWITWGWVNDRFFLSELSHQVLFTWLHQGSTTPLNTSRSMQIVANSVMNGSFFHDKLLTLCCLMLMIITLNKKQIELSSKYDLQVCSRHIRVVSLHTEGTYSSIYCYQLHDSSALNGIEFFPFIFPWLSKSQGKQAETQKTHSPSKTVTREKMTGIHKPFKSEPLLTFPAYVLSATSTTIRPSSKNRTVHFYKN